MQKGLVSGLDRLRSEAQGSGEKNQKCDSGCVMQKYKHFKCHRDVRKEVEAPLDIKDVIHQISCFSKTIVMKITLPSVGRTSTFSMMYDR